MSIIKSIHTSGTEGRFDESVSYNANGSILSLLRGGMKNDGTFGTIDDLTITYDGNQLVKVSDDAEALNYNGALDFHDGADTDVEYTYDNNGALTKDGNRGINSITYDYGHHPYYINMNMTSGPRNIRNDYTPDGRKLSSKHVMSFRMVNGFIRKTTTDLYIDGLILRGDTTLLWQFDGGYVDLDANGTPTCWNYYVTDHLGSTRMVVSSNDSIKEVINYYPFGSEMRMELPAQMTSDPSHPFRFIGKELDRQNGLNMYDFGARLFDVAGVPMWTSVDPLAEKYYPYSPYAYCAGDPVNKFDPDGKKIYIPKGSQTKVLTMINSYSKTQYEVDKNGYMRVNNTNINENGSAHYSERLDATISAKGKLTITVSDKYTSLDGKSIDVEKVYGGGLTITNKTNNTDVKTIVTGKNHIVHDTNGNEVKKSGGEVLIHEIVGHAAPAIAGSETGNAVDNENIVRKELNLQEREKEVNHVE